MRFEARFAPRKRGFPLCGTTLLRRQIRHHRIEHRESGLRDPQPAAVIDR